MNVLLNKYFKSLYLLFITLYYYQLCLIRYQLIYILFCFLLNYIIIIIKHKRYATVEPFANFVLMTIKPLYFLHQKAKCLIYCILLLCGCNKREHVAKMVFHIGDYEEELDQEVQKSHRLNSHLNATQTLTGQTRNLFSTSLI